MDCVGRGIHIRTEFERKCWQLPIPRSFSALVLEPKDGKRPAGICQSWKVMICPLRRDFSDTPPSAPLGTGAPDLGVRRSLLQMPASGWAVRPPGADGLVSDNRRQLRGEAIKECVRAVQFRLCLQYTCRTRSRIVIPSNYDHPLNSIPDSISIEVEIPFTFAFGAAICICGRRSQSGEP